MDHPILHTPPKHLYLLAGLLAVLAIAVCGLLFFNRDTEAPAVQTQAPTNQSIRTLTTDMQSEVAATEATLGAMDANADYNDALLSDNALAN